MDEIYDELENEHPTTFGELYYRDDNNNEDEDVSSKRPFEYVNSSQKIKTFDDETGESFAENAFVCLCSAKRERKFVKFYVSEEYDVRDVSHSTRIAGRFIFTSTEDNKLKVRALAEEPAEGMSTASTSAVESLYLRKKGTNKPGNTVIYKNNL
jgi:tRNA(Ile2) C34 agmatinyltransferase TiaS